MKKKTCQLKGKYNSFTFGMVFFLLALIVNSKVNGQTKIDMRSADTTLKVTQKKTPSTDPTVKTVSVSTQQYPITISKKNGEEQVVHDEAYWNKELERINLHIKAIDAKIESINADPAKKSKAENDGWFDDMSKTKSSLIQDRENALKELEKFKQ
jgi:hypothetical protein